VRENGDVATELEVLFNELKQTEDKAIIQVPNIQDRADLETFRGWFSNQADKDSAEAIWKLSGRSVRVRTDQDGNTALDYDNTFPDDVMPMLVLDASGQQRHTYELWHHNRQGLQFLPSPPKGYSPLTISHWDRGSGKSKRTDWDEIADGVAKAIYSLPDGETIDFMDGNLGPQKFIAGKDTLPRWAKPSITMCPPPRVNSNACCNGRMPVGSGPTSVFGGRVSPPPLRR
jgi:hypothetical protein